MALYKSNNLAVYIFLMRPPRHNKLGNVRDVIGETERTVCVCVRAQNENSEFSSHNNIAPLSYCGNILHADNAAQARARPSTHKKTFQCK